MKHFFSSVFTVASALAIVGLASCSNENDPQIPEGEKGIPTAMSLTLNMKGVQTRANQNPEGLKPEDYTTTAETEVKTLHVYIYDVASGLLDNNYDLDRYQADGITETGDITYDNGAKTYTTKALKAFTGEKKVYVGLNLTDAMKTVLQKNSLQTLNTSAVTEELENMIDNTTGFSMFSPAGEDGNFQEATDANVPAGNKVAIDVERMVAKIGLGAKNKPTELGAAGTLSGLQWVVDNIGKKFYMPATQKDPSMSADVWAAADFLNYDFKQDKDWNQVAIVWNNLVENGDRTKWTTAYSTENFVNDNKLKGMTRVVVRGKYTPDLAVTYTLDANGDLTQAQTAITEGSTYYQIVVEGDDKFVFLAGPNAPAEDDVKAYYKKVTQKDYVGTDILDKCVKTYTGGYNYWWVTMAEKGQEGNVERNHVYLANVNSISLPGRTEGEFNEDKDKDDELDQETNIDITVTVLDWAMVTFDADLKP